jgi:hypothetical protein
MATVVNKPKAKSKSGTLTCPECGRTFTRPQGLGAHRRQAHGVLGTSVTATRRNAGTTTKRRRGRPAATAAATSATAIRRTRSAATTRRSSAVATISNGSKSSVNRDGLLQTLFPAGMPAREAVIQAVNNWLQEAERLTRMR